MQKIDTNGVPLYARIVRATVNNKRKLRVYINQEVMGDFNTIQEALKFIRHDRSKNQGQGDGRVLHEEQKL